MNASSGLALPSRLALQDCIAWHYYQRPVTARYLSHLAFALERFGFDLACTEQTLSRLSFYLMLIYGLILVGVLANLSVEMTRTTPRPLTKSKKAKIHERRSFPAYVGKIPFTELTAMLDEEAILCAKMLVTHPVYGPLQHSTQNVIIARIVKDLVKHLDGFSIATCPLKAYKTAGAMTRYQVEKDWFDIARYCKGEASKVPVLPPFSIFIAAVYYSVSNVERVELASAIAKSPLLRKAASDHLSEILDAIGGQNQEGQERKG